MSELVNLIRHYGVKIVIDVRRFPTSARYPWFKGEEMEKLLISREMEYHHLGELLGGYRSGGYRAYTETMQYKEGIRKLLSIAGGARTAILCSERFPWRCHRRFIARTLEEMSVPVVHIIDRDHVWIPKESKRLLESTP